jgi:hypothetical protein
LQPEETQVHLAGKDIPIFEGRKDAKCPNSVTA